MLENILIRFPHDLEEISLKTSSSQTAYQNHLKKFFKLHMLITVYEFFKKLWFFSPLNFYEVLGWEWSEADILSPQVCWRLTHHQISSIWDLLLTTMCIPFLGYYVQTQLTDSDYEFVALWSWSHNIKHCGLGEHEFSGKDITSTVK